VLVVDNEEIKIDGKIKSLEVVKDQIVVVADKDGIRSVYRYE
jgi:hypothetical protein